MKPADIVTLLQSFGFSGLSLISAEANTSTFRFQDYDHRGLVKSLGEPSIAGGGKVAVFQVPKVARIGVSPANSVVRFLYEGVTNGTSSHHLGMVKVTPALSTLFLKAQVTPGLRLGYLKKLWQYLNKDKFDSRMTEPRLGLKDSLGKGVRAHYLGRRDFSTGAIEVANFLFNGREPFFLEIFLHEMCHQATRELSHSLDMDQNGHGPVWQQWMVDVGLDPRRYDPTDEAEYLNHSDLAAKESQLNMTYGARASEAMVSKLKPTKPVDGVPIYFLYQGRLARGFIEGRRFHGENVMDKKLIVVSFKTAAALKSYQFFKV